MKSDSSFFHRSISEELKGDRNDRRRKIHAGSQEAGNESL